MLDVKPIARAVMPRPLRNWLRSPSRSIEWSWQHTRFLLGQREVVEIRPGLRLVCHPLAYRHSYRAQCEDPEQVAEFDCFIARCTPGMILFDVGAHFGLFALAALHYGGPTARAVAIDVSPTAVGMIVTQARLNGVSRRLQVVCGCVCDGTGTRDMVAVGPLADGYYTPPTPITPSTEMTSTMAVTLDGLVDETGLWPSHVKIDVEGAEAAVLQGGQRLLTGPRPPILFIELHNALIREQGGDPREVPARLHEAGYSAFGLDGAPVSAAELLATSLVRFAAWKS
jgi:FkbM family methyltransferase